MKKLFFIIALIVCCISTFLSCNKSKTKEDKNVQVEAKNDEELMLQWSKTELAYQKRYDFATNVIHQFNLSTSAKDEVTKCIEARSIVSSMNINGNNINKENFADFEKKLADFEKTLESLMLYIKDSTTINELKKIEEKVKYETEKLKVILN